MVIAADGPFHNFNQRVFVYLDHRGVRGGGVSDGKHATANSPHHRYGPGGGLDSGKTSPLSLIGFEGVRCHPTIGPSLDASFAKRHLTQITSYSFRAKTFGLRISIGLRKQRDIWQTLIEVRHTGCPHE